MARLPKLNLLGIPQDKLKNSHKNIVTKECHTFLGVLITVGHLLMRYMHDQK